MRGGEIGEDGVLGDEIADHDKASAPDIEGAEEGRFDPFGEVADSLLVATELVVVDIVDHDIVGACFAIAETARRLSTSAGKKLDAGGSLELAVLPGAVGLL